MQLSLGYALLQFNLLLYLPTTQYHAYFSMQWKLEKIWGCTQYEKKENMPSLVLSYEDAKIIRTNSYYFIPNEFGINYIKRPN